MDLLWIFAKRFVAGKTIEQALPKVKDLNNKNMLVTLDILGENVTNKEEPEKFLDGYIHVLNLMAEEKIKGGISVKPTMMGLSISPDMCRTNIARILDVAVKHDIFVRVDMEGTDYVQSTLDVVYDLHKDYKNMGTVIQAYLYRSEEDINTLVEKGISVRLCKGAYKEPANLAIQKMDDIRENFIKLSKVLMKDSNVRHAIATHDDILIDWAKEWANQEGISKEAYEFQMLYGIRNDSQESLAEEGYTFRTYVPFGTHWFPYFYRRLRERKENIWFIAKNMFKK
jgi:proline dehydrogenase